MDFKPRNLTVVDILRKSVSYVDQHGFLRQKLWLSKVLMSLLIISDHP